MACSTTSSTIHPQQKDSDLAKFFAAGQWMSWRNPNSKTTVLGALDRMVVVTIPDDFNATPLNIQKNANNPNVISLAFVPEVYLRDPKQAEMTRITLFNAHRVPKTEEGSKLKREELLQLIFSLEPDNVVDNRVWRILEDKPDGLKFLCLEGGKTEQNDGLIIYGKIIKQDNDFFLVNHMVMVKHFNVEDLSTSPLTVSILQNMMQQLDLSTVCSTENSDQPLCRLMQKRVMASLKDIQQKTNKPALSKDTMPAVPLLPSVPSAPANISKPSTK